MKKLLAILLALTTVSVALAQEKPHSFLPKLKKKPKVEVPAKYPDEYLDTVNLNKKLRLNNYSMIGFEYGVSRNSQLFTPRFQSQPVFFPEYFGVTFTRYGELIGSPIVGFQIGAFYGHEGYEFKIDEKTGGVFVIVFTSGIFSCAHDFERRSLFDVFGQPHVLSGAVETVVETIYIFLGNNVLQIVGRNAFVLLGSGAASSCRRGRTSLDAPMMPTRKAPSARE